MKIEIDYNGAYAVCKVDGKHIMQCDALTRGIALSAFSCIEQHVRREAQAKKEKRECVDLSHRVRVPVQRLDDGNYRIFYKNDKQMYIAGGYGKTPEEAKENFYFNLDDVRRNFKDSGRFFEELSFEFVVEEGVSM